MAPPTAAVHVEMLLAFLGKPSVCIFAHPTQKQTGKEEKAVFTKQTAKKRLLQSNVAIYATAGKVVVVLLFLPPERRRESNPRELDEDLETYSPRDSYSTLIRGIVTVSRAWVLCLASTNPISCVTGCG